MFLGTVAVRSERPGAIVYDVNANEAAVVVTSQIACPGWSVSLDGHPIVPLTANGLFVALSVERGRHTVLLHYTPVPVQLGLYLSALSGLLISAIWTLRFTRSVK